MRDRKPRYDSAVSGNETEKELLKSVVGKWTSRDKCVYGRVCLRRSRQRVWQRHWRCNAAAPMKRRSYS